MNSLKACFVFFAVAAFAPSFSQVVPVPLHWVDDSPVIHPTGVSWGVPWPRGTVKKNQSFTLINNQGMSIPVQSWTTAYWPDGSVKWTGFAAVAGTQQGDLQLNITSNPVETASLAVENAYSIVVNTGDLRCVINRKGNFLVNSLLINGRLVARNGRLSCILQNGPEHEDP